MKALTRNRFWQLLGENYRGQAQPTLRVEKAKGSADTTIYVYDVIDEAFGIRPQTFAAAVAQADPKATLHVRINCPGGDGFASAAMAAAVRDFKGDTVAHVDGLAAGPATALCCAAKEVVMGIGAYLVVAPTWGVAFGNRFDMAAMAALQARFDADLCDLFAQRTGASAEQVLAWMDAETWFNAAETVAAGFADRVAEAAERDPPDPAAMPPATRTAARWNLGAYSNAPGHLRGRNAAPQADAADAAADFEHSLRRARLLRLH